MAGINRIVVGVDGSDSSKHALQWAYEEAAHHDSSLTVVTVWHVPPLPMSPGYGSPTPEGYGGQPQQEALALLDRLTAELVPRDPAVKVQTSVEEGRSPVKVLIERSREADLLVVGSRGLGGFAGMLLGSVSQHLVAHADCPVVVIR